MAEYDLTKTIIPYLDRHLVLPLLAHLQETALFPEEDVGRAQYELAKVTNMIDLSVSLFKKLHPGEEPPEGVLNQLVASDLSMLTLEECV
jgi:translation initiation factor 3 subunit E